MISKLVAQRQKLKFNASPLSVTWSLVSLENVKLRELTAQFKLKF